MCIEYTDVLRVRLLREPRPFGFDSVRFTLDPKPNGYYSQSQEFYFTDQDDRYKRHVAGFYINRMPGLVIPTNAWVVPPLRGLGIGKWLATQRVLAFDELRQTEPCAEEHLMMLCRCKPDNEVQQHILEEVGWQRISRHVWTYGGD